MEANLQIRELLGLGVRDGVGYRPVGYPLVDLLLQAVVDARGRDEQVERHPQVVGRRVGPGDELGQHLGLALFLGETVADER